MQWDIWYDLAVLELSGLGDPARQKLAEAEKARGPVAPDVEEPVDVRAKESA